MPTVLHESVVQQCIDAGYRVNGAQEFARLAYYLNEVLGLDARDILMEFFRSEKLVNHHNAKRLAKNVRRSLPDGDSLPDYIEIRDAIPAHSCRPDAWLYRPSLEIEGAMVIELVEVLDTSRTSLSKLAQYGRAFNDHTKTQLMVFEIGAKDGSHVRHDPFYALQLFAGRQLYGIFYDDEDAFTDEMEGLYAKWMQGGRQMLPSALIERYAA